MITTSRCVSSDSESESPLGANLNASTTSSGGKDPEIRQNLVHHNTNTIVHQEQLVIVGNLVLANCLYFRRLVLSRARNLVLIAYLIV